MRARSCSDSLSRVMVLGTMPMGGKVSVLPLPGMLGRLLLLLLWASLGLRVLVVLSKPAALSETFLLWLLLVSASAALVPMMLWLLLVLASALSTLVQRCCDCRFWR